ncbi:MAG TPA: ATP-binding protein [Chloroflexota bacterium]|nr:ATP-binding protein [Chloroflexota bacterium]
MSIEGGEQRYTVQRILERGAQRPALGAAIGLILVVLLVPLLSVLGGASGTFGPSLPLFFLVPVLLAATLSGRVAGAIVAVAAVFAWDWFFIPPLYTVTIYYPRDVLALFIFLLVALLTGQLATATRRRAEDAMIRARSSEALYALSTALIAHHELRDMLDTLTHRLQEAFDLRACAVLLPRGPGAGWHTAATAGSIPPELSVETSREISSIVANVIKTGQAVGMVPLEPDGAASHGGLGDGAMPRLARRARFLPLKIENRPIGVLELILKPGVALDGEREQLMTTFANGAALALEQARLAQEEQEAAIARASDELKTALLSSVSHDLRTPLAGIKAAASSLLQEDVEWSADDRRAFLQDIDGEVDRLTRLVSNLLDLSRIEGGAIKLQLEWEDPSEVIFRVLRHLEGPLAGHPVSVQVDQVLPPVRVDAIRMEQVLTNLLENAAKYSEPGAPIEVRAFTAPTSAGEELRIEVRDHGPGIPPAERARIFDKFYRLSGNAKRTPGVGLGLSIARAFVEAHQGRIEVESEVGAGSTFRVVLPPEPVSTDLDQLERAGDCGGQAAAPPGDRQKALRS